MFDFLLGNDLLAAIIAFGLVLIPAVIVHEFGHFLAARMVGITVLEFGIGFPPKITRLFMWKETEFTLNWLPLGGFVRPLGEDMIRPVSEEKTEQQRQQLQAAESARHEQQAEAAQRPTEREILAARGVTKMKAVHEAGPWERIWFMVAGALGNFIFAFVLFVLVGLIGLPQVVGMRIGFAQIEPESPWYAAGFREGYIIEEIDGDYFATSDDLFARMAESVDQPVTLSGSRPEGDGLVPFSITLTPDAAFTQTLQSIDGYVLVTGVDADSPAEAAGLLAGDLIAYFNAEQIVNTDDPVAKVQELTQQFAGQEVELTIVRDTETLQVRLTPRITPPVGQGRMGIGIRFEAVPQDRSFTFAEGIHRETVPQPPLTALNYGVDRLTNVLNLIAQFPARLLSNQTAPEERRVVSVVGVSQMGGVVLQDSIQENAPFIILEYIALISIALGFTNLLPLPALDGGRILFVVIELLRGRPMAPEREGVIHLFGLVFLLSVAVIFIVNDLVNPITNLMR